MLSVTREYVKKRANISREGKTLEGMHKTPSKTKRKKSTHINTRKKSTPHAKKVLQLFLNCGHDKNMESRTPLNIRKSKFTTWRTCKP